MTKVLKIYHLDDDLLFLERIAKKVANAAPKGYLLQVTSCSSAGDFLAKIQFRPAIDIIVLDIRLADDNHNGKSMVASCMKFLPKVPIVMCSDLSDIQTVVECMQLGAKDFLFKSASDEEMATRLMGAYWHYRAAPPQPATPNLQGPAPIHGGETIAAIAVRVPKILASAITSVHVYGETGTGKELVAELFKDYLPPRTPFATLNCGAIADNLIESELFGHIKGSFTGADSHKTGILAAAHGGWLFLDEVNSLSEKAQMALLRSLESRVIRPVGAANEQPIQLSILSAANEPLDELVAKGKFRQDLWQRLCETTIELPPLRDRPEEVTAIIDAVMDKMAGGPYTLSAAAKAILVEYDWHHGNVRELRNTLRAMTERAVDGQLTPLAIPKELWQKMTETLDPRGHLSGTDLRQLGGAEHSGVPDSRRQLTIRWEEPEFPAFHLLQLKLLAEMIERSYKKHGQMTLRQLAPLVSIPRSTLTTRLKELISDDIVTPDQLNAWLGDRSQGAARPSD